VFLFFGVVLVVLHLFYSSLLLFIKVVTSINLCMANRDFDFMEILVSRYYKEDLWPQVDHWIT
jgi:hypothetical protein